MSDRDDILKVLRDQEAANARGDAIAVLAPIAESVVLFDLPPPLQANCDAAEGREALEAWFGTWDGGVTVKLQDPQVIVDGKLAVVFGLSHMQGSKNGEGPVDAWNRRTVVLRKQEGEWKIVHEHNSYPTAMDGSGRSLTDLNPE